MKQALFVGRFQPFHLGHLDAIKKILEKEDRLIIVIGSAEKNHFQADPFTAGERYQMIEESLLQEGFTHDQFSIIPVRNIGNYILWTEHVDQYIPPVYKIYTGSLIVKELYSAQGKYKIEDIVLELPITGTSIRDKILNDDSSWEKDVHPKVAEMIKNWKGIERIKMIA